MTTKITIESGIAAIFSVIGIFLYLFNYSLNYDQDLMVMTAGYVILLSVVAIVKTRHNWLLTIISFVILLTNYSICIANYIFPITTTYYTQWAFTATSFKAINIMLLFMSVLVIVMPSTFKNEVQNNENKYLKHDNSNDILLVAFVLVLVFILLFMFRRPERIGDRGAPTAMYEYSIIIFLLGFYFAGRKKKWQYVLIVLVAAFALQNFIFGGRVTAVELITLVFVLLFSYKAQLSKVLPLMILAIVAMYIIGSLRGNMLYMLSPDVIVDVFKKTINTRFAWDGAYAAYYTSMTFLEIEDIYDVSARIGFLNSFLASMIMGENSVDGSSLALISSAYYHHDNGGLLPFFFHFYLGNVGVVIGALLIGLLCRWVAAKNENSDYKLLLKVWIAVTVFRWYLYSPAPLLRGVLLFSIVYIVAVQFDKRKKTREESGILVQI